MQVALIACFVVLASFVSHSSVMAQAAESEHPDAVVVRSESQTITRRGTITDWRGSSLTLQIGNRSTSIENETIASLQTSWPDDYVKGHQLLASGEAREAISSLQAGLQTESRPWAKNMIRADLIRAHQLLEDHPAAIQQFLALTASDPQTRFYYLCPLLWTGGNPGMQSVVQAMLTNHDPTQQLIAASWLLTSSQQADAAKVLESLSRDITPQIKHLATAQLWRLQSTNLNSLTERRLKFWEQQIADMPAELRSGPWMLLADAQFRTGQTDQAIINFMRIPILYPDQFGLSAAALYQASVLLHNTDRHADASIVAQELKQKFPATIWAQQSN